MYLMKRYSNENYEMMKYLDFESKIFIRPVMIKSIGRKYIFYKVESWAILVDSIAGLRVWLVSWNGIVRFGKMYEK